MAELEISDQELFDILIEVEEAAFVAGKEPRTRHFTNVMDVIQCVRPGQSTVLMGANASPIVHRIHQMNDQLFRPEDKQTGGVHMGCYMFRDTFVRVYVPIIFGQAALNPLEHTDLNETQKHWISSSEEYFYPFEDQFLDLVDSGYGFMELGHSRLLKDQTKSFLYSSRFHVQAAAAVALSAYDFSGAAQNAILATELALKSVLIEHGYSDKQLREVGHDLTQASSLASSFETSLDKARLSSVCSNIPSYVENRYSAEQPSRIEMGHLIMKAQYVTSEVTRAFTDRNIRGSAEGVRARSYPPSMLEN